MRGPETVGEIPWNPVPRGGVRLAVSAEGSASGLICAHRFGRVFRRSPVSDIQRLTGRMARLR